MYDVRSQVEQRLANRITEKHKYVESRNITIIFFNYFQVISTIRHQLRTQPHQPQAALAPLMIHHQPPPLSWTGSNICQSAEVLPRMIEMVAIHPTPNEVV